MAQSATSTHHRLGDEPTLDEARCAVEALAAMPDIPHISRVMLFGSLARGQVSPESDIDLVVVVDDLGDYSTRYNLQRDMAKAARGSAGHHVDIHLTDLAEWACRSETVTASFEASLIDHAVVMLERHPISNPDWSKIMTKPTTNLEEAAVKQTDMCRHAYALGHVILPHQDELTAEVEERTWMTQERMCQICGAAARLIESSIKTVTATHGVSPKHTHSIENALKQIPVRGQRDQLAEMVKSSRVPMGDISKWHVRSNYTNDIKKQRSEAEAQAPALLQLAHDCATYADSVFRQAGGVPESPKRLENRLRDMRGNAQEGLGVQVLNNTHHIAPVSMTDVLTPDSEA